MAADKRCYWCGRTFLADQVEIVRDTNGVGAWFCKPCKAEWDAAVAEGRRQEQEGS